MFWNIILLEIDKLFKRGMFWIELAILALLITSIDLAQYFIARGLPQQDATSLTKSLTWPVGLTGAVQFADAHALGGMLLIILIGAVTVREYSWRTIHLWLGHGVSRSALLGAKFVVSLLPLLMILLTSLIVSGGITGCLTYAFYGTLNLHLVDIQQLTLLFLATGYSLFPYIALTFLLAVASRSMGVTIGVGFAFTFLVEGTGYTMLAIMGGNLTQGAQYLPIGLSAVLENDASGSLSLSSWPPPGMAVAGIALYTVVFCALALWIFRRQSFTN